MDLVATDEQDKVIFDRLTRTLPTYAHERCERWARTSSSDVAAAFAWIGGDGMSLRRRNTFDVMRQLAERDGLVDFGGW